ncbi:MAG: S1 RNA-binding domain-containing protein [Synergistaceae bacterium]|nr:S1 RNA-binding domain-containing protein [Synergistaceae bacterium]
MAESAGVEVGEIVECTVEQIMPYGAFVRITKTGRKGMIHISELSYSFVKDINAVLKVSDKIQAKVIRIDEKGRIDLSLKQTQEPPAQPSRPPRRIMQSQDTNGRPPREYRSVTRENRAPRETRDFHEMQNAYREANPEEADSFEKKMASFLKTSEAKITDLNTRNSARSGRPTRRRNNSRDY